MVINDIHFPFHNPRLIHYDCTGLIPDLLEEIPFDRLILNGDILDMYNWNSYGIHPAVNVDMEEELAIGLQFIKALRKRFPKLKIVFLYGNHEDRFERWIIKEAKPIYNLFKLETELRLEEHDIEFHYYNHKYQIEKSNVFVQHSPPSYAENGAGTSLKKKHDQSFIFGCTHREQHHTITGGSGKVYECWFNGWLGKWNETKDHEKVYSYRKGHAAWQNCFITTATYDQEFTHITQHGIRDEKVFIEGDLWEA